MRETLRRWGSRCIQSGSSSRPLQERARSGLNIPVAIGGVAGGPGDIVVGDDGVVVHPPRTLNA